MFGVFYIVEKYSEIDCQFNVLIVLSMYANNFFDFNFYKMDFNY